MNNSILNSLSKSTCLVLKMYLIFNFHRTGIVLKHCKLCLAKLWMEAQAPPRIVCQKAEGGVYEVHSSMNTTDQA